MGTSDHVITVYSIIDEDVITYAYVYDQSTKIIFRDGIIYSGMRNGQFCKLHFMEKPKLLQPVKNKTNGKRQAILERKPSKTAVTSMISAEELFQGFGFYEDGEKDEIILKPKGLRQILDPEYVKNMTMEKKSKFHKMSAAIVSPDEIARIAKLEDERKMKLELKLKHAVAIGNILPGSPTGILKYRNSMTKSQKDKATTPDSPGSPNDRHRRNSKYHSFPSFELRSENIIKETEEPEDQKSEKTSRLTPQMADAALKWKPKTGNKGSYGSKRKISKQNSGRIRAQWSKRSDSQKDTESIGETSQSTSLTENNENLPIRKETPSPGHFLKNKQSKSVGETSSRQNDRETTRKKSSAVMSPQRKTLSRAKSLPELKPRSRNKDHRISKSRSPKRSTVETREPRNMLQSIVSQYEENVSRLTKQKNCYQPNLRKREIVPEPFSFLSRPAISTRPKTHDGCMPVLYNDVTDGLINSFEVNGNGNEQSNPKLSVALKHSTQNGIKKEKPMTTWVDNPSLRVPGRYINTFDLNTYYPMVLPRTKLPEGGRKISTSKFVHYPPQIQLAPTDDFFDTKLIPLKF